MGAIGNELPTPARHGQNERAIATYRKEPAPAKAGVTGGFRSEWGADFYAALRSVIGTARRRGVDAYTTTLDTLRGNGVLAPG